MEDKTKKKKTKKEVQEEVKVHDLKPVKDAKGGLKASNSTKTSVYSGQ